MNKENVEKEKFYECPDCSDFCLEKNLSGDYWCPECGQTFVKLDIENGMAKEIEI